MTWILGSAAHDVIAFYFLPALLVGLGLWSPGLLMLPAAAIVVFQWFDIGHTTSTIFRVFPQWGKSRLFSAGLPSVIFAAIAAGFMALPNETALTIAYFTAFHHVRQFYGINRWYQHLNQNESRWSGWWLYSLTVLPIVLFHFRWDIDLTLVSRFDIPRFYNPEVQLALEFTYYGCWIGWGIFELLQMRKRVEINRILSIFIPALLSYWCFTQAMNMQTVLFPMLTVHSVSYFFLVDRKASQDKSRFLWIAMTALFFGLFFGTLEALGGEFAPGWLSAALLGIALTPNVWHYIVDGFIWKKRDLVAA